MKDLKINKNYILEWFKYSDDPFRGGNILWMRSRGEDAEVRLISYPNDIFEIRIFISGYDTKSNIFPVDYISSPGWKCLPKKSLVSSLPQNIIHKLATENDLRDFLQASRNHSIGIDETGKILMVSNYLEFKVSKKQISSIYSIIFRSFSHLDGDVDIILSK